MFLLLYFFSENYLTFLNYFFYGYIIFSLFFYTKSENLPVRQDAKLFCCGGLLLRDLVPASQMDTITLDYGIQEHEESCPCGLFYTR